jgi:hypothetical protein
VRVRHLPTREHTRVAGLYPPANLPAGKKPYPCPHLVGTRGYWVYPCPQRGMRIEEEVTRAGPPPPATAASTTDPPAAASSPFVLVFPNVTASSQFGLVPVRRRGRRPRGWWRNRRRQRAAAWGAGSRMVRRVSRAVCPRARLAGGGCPLPASGRPTLDATPPGALERK